MAEWNWGIEQHVEHFYSKEFPFHVRGQLANFFNENNWFLRCNPYSQSSDTRKFIDGFIVSMKQELQKIYDLLPNDGLQNSFYRKKFRKYCEKVQNSDNFQLFILIRSTLDKETCALRQLNSVRNAESMDTLPSPSELYEQAKKKVNDDLRAYKENCDSIYNRLVQLDENGDKSAMNLIKEKHEVDQLASQYIKNLRAVQADILERLADYKDKQRYVTFVCKEKADGNNSVARSSALDDIGSFLRKLADCMAVMFAFSTKYKATFKKLASSTVKIEDWTGELTRFEEKTKAVCFVIERQPSQIMRTGNIYQMKIRVLPWTNLRMEITNVHIVLINKATANGIKNLLGTFESISSPTPEQKCAAIANALPISCGTLDNQPEDILLENNILSLTKLKIMKVTRSKPRGRGKHVVEERFWLYFRVQTDVTEGDSPEIAFFHGVSLPISIPCHSTSQEIHTVPQLIWFNSCPSHLHQIPGLQEPMTLNWTYIREQMDLEFTKLGQPLTYEQANFLKMKMFRWIKKSDDMASFFDYCERNITVTQIIENKDQTPGPSNEVSRSHPKQISISYGEWIYGCQMVLNSDPKPGSKALKELWREGKIIGFMDKQQMMAMLSSPGMCIIFFPESSLEEIGIYYFDKEVGGLAKFSYTISELNVKALDERILDNPRISHLYITWGDGYRLVEKAEALEIKSHNRRCVPNEKGYFCQVPMKIQEDLSSITSELETVTLNDGSS